MKEKAVYYYRQGFNCSQCILKAAEACFNIPMNKQSVSMCQAVSMGFGCGLFCSVLVAGVMLFGVMFDDVTAKRLRLELLAKFNEKHGSFDCGMLKKERRPSASCEGLIGDTAEMIQDIIERELGRE